MICRSGHGPVPEEGAPEAVKRFERMHYACFHSEIEHVRCRADGRIEPTRLEASAAVEL